jgi:hypothetical protein
MISPFRNILTQPNPKTPDYQTIVVRATVFPFSLKAPPQPLPVLSLFVLSAAST